MRDYGRVATAFWTDEKIAQCSNDGKLVGLYLLTSPHSNALGCYRLPLSYIEEDIGGHIETDAERFRNPSETVSKGFQELSGWFLEYDFQTKWAFLPRYLRYNPIDNPNVGKMVIRQLEQVPDNVSFGHRIRAFLQEYCDKLPDGWETLCERFRNPSETLSEPFRNIEPEPEPEPVDPSQEHNVSGGTNYGGTG